MTEINSSNSDKKQAPPEQTGLTGETARTVDKLSIAERMRLKPRTLKRLMFLAIFYFIAVAGTVIFLDLQIAGNAIFGIFLPYVVFFAFLFETMDSAAGMGFGTALAPLLLLVFGFEPLTIVPAILISQTFSGLITGWMHNEFENVEISLQRPFRKETKAVGIIAVISALGVLSSVLFAYFAIHFNEGFITAYVTILVFVMAAATLFRKYFKSAAAVKYRPKRLYGFAVLAGFNKGIGGGGYGPVTTMGQLYAGMYEKAAAGITSISEGLASLVGVAAYFSLTAAGVDLNLMLLPSLLAGSFLAAIIAPYSVRIIPNRIYRYVIPGYALAIGIFLLYALFFL